MSGGACKPRGYFRHDQERRVCPCRKCRGQRILSLRAIRKHQRKWGLPRDYVIPAGEYEESQWPTNSAHVFGRSMLPPSGLLLPISASMPQFEAAVNFRISAVHHKVRDPNTYIGALGIKCQCWMCRRMPILNLRMHVCTMAQHIYYRILNVQWYCNTLASEWDLPLWFCNAV